MDLFPFWASDVDMEWTWNSIADIAPDTPGNDSAIGAIAGRVMWQGVGTGIASFLTVEGVHYLSNSLFISQLL